MPLRTQTLISCLLIFLVLPTLIALAYFSFRVGDINSLADRELLSANDKITYDLPGAIYIKNTSTTTFISSGSVNYIIVVSSKIPDHSDRNASLQPKGE